MSPERPVTKYHWLVLLLAALSLMKQLIPETKLLNK